MITENGISTTAELGAEKWEEFRVNRKRHIQYDYRHIDGELFSCVGRTLIDCQLKKEQWLDKKNGVVPYVVQRIGNPVKRLPTAYAQKRLEAGACLQLFLWYKRLPLFSH